MQKHRELQQTIDKGEQKEIKRNLQKEPSNRDLPQETFNDKKVYLKRNYCAQFTPQPPSHYTHFSTP